MSRSGVGSPGGSGEGAGQVLHFGEEVAQGFGVDAVAAGAAGDGGHGGAGGGFQAGGGEDLVEDRVEFGAEGGGVDGNAGEALLDDTAVSDRVQILADRASPSSIALEVAVSKVCRQSCGPLGSRFRPS